MINAIAAMNRRRVIGRDNDLIWRLPNDLKRLHLLTSGSPVIMGRKTWDSLPASIRPLDGGRTTIVLTRDTSFTAPGVHRAGSWEEAKTIAMQSPGKEKIWVFGGGQIFTTAFDDLDRIYATVVENDDDDPTSIHFPDFSKFEVIPNENPEDNGIKTEIDRKSGKEIQYKFVTFAHPASKPS